MNTMNNKRRQSSQKKIREAYTNLVLERNDIQSITVSDICKNASVNRTTFYANCNNVEDLKESVREWILTEFLRLFPDEVNGFYHSLDFCTLFDNIKAQPWFYQLYFKLGFDFTPLFLQNDVHSMRSSFYTDSKNMDYHVAFFQAGITALIKKWVENGCDKSSEEVMQILKDEYAEKKVPF